MGQYLASLQHYLEDRRISSQGSTLREVGLWNCCNTIFKQWLHWNPPCSSSESYTCQSEKICGRLFLFYGTSLETAACSQNYSHCFLWFRALEAVPTIISVIVIEIKISLLVMQSHLKATFHGCYWCWEDLWNKTLLMGVFLQTSRNGLCNKALALRSNCLSFQPFCPEVREWNQTLMILKRLRQGNFSALDF